MYVFHGDLEAIEAAGLRDLDLLAKPLHLAANTCKVSPRNNDRGPGAGGAFWLQHSTFRGRFKVCSPMYFFAVL